MQNLRDKLLKAGLVTEDQAKKSEADTPNRRKDRPAGPPPERQGAPRNAARPQGERPSRPPPNRPPPRPGGHKPSRPAEESRIPKLPPMPGSKAAQRMESKKQLELDRKLRELVHAGQVPMEAGPVTFYFVTRKNRLRRLEVSEAQAKLLESGALAVVERPEPAQIEHSLVPPETAEKMLALSTKSVRFFNKSGSPVGFISDDELKQRQEAEKQSGPEDESRGPEDEAEAEAAEAAAAEEGASAGEGVEAEAPAEGSAEGPGSNSGEPSAS